MTIVCREEELILNKNRAIYWAAKEILIISDLHLGKSATFRRAGIQVPATVSDTDLAHLSLLIQEYTPKTLIVTGDMFHHQLNADIATFSAWRKQHEWLNIKLIKGNHDRLKNADYESLNIEVMEKEFIIAPFRFVHDQPEVKDEFYNISGHIHPGITVYGKSRQSIKLPCFYFGKTCAILPAFSVFTGLSKIKAQEGDQFYAITPDRVVAI